MPRTILILAGRRPGAVDPLAQAHDVDDQCLVPVGGEPMLMHILRAALASDAEQVIVATHNGQLAAVLADRLAVGDASRVRFVRPAGNLANSVLMAAEDAAFPMLVTTADACLLSAKAMAEIDRLAAVSGADAAVALARKADVLAAYPDEQRRFHGFTDVAVSNCNAYWIAGPAALRAAEAFRGGGQLIKKPLRLLRAFGLINLIRFRYGLGPIHVVFDRLGRHMRLKLVPVLVSDGAAAIDVDNARSFAVTEQIMAGGS